MQFGRALQRVLTQIVHADPRFGPPKLAKIDIADGFYRVWLQVRDIPRLGVLLPRSGHAESTPLVAFPLALPMGWVESPPYFTTVTETACDLANAAIRQGGPIRPHRLKGAASTPPSITTSDAMTPGTTWRRSTPLGGAFCPDTWGPRTHILVRFPAHRWPVPTYMSTTFSSPRRRSGSKPGFCEQLCTPLTKFSVGCATGTPVIAKSRPQSRSCSKGTHIGIPASLSWGGNLTPSKGHSACPRTASRGSTNCWILCSPHANACHSRNGTSY